MFDIIYDWFLDRNKKYGFIVQLATPVRDPQKSYSWGHYTTEWFYFEDTTKIGEVAIEWVDCLHKKWREE